MADSLSRDHLLRLVLDKLGLPRSTYYRYAGGRNPKADRWADVRPLVREAFSRTPNGMGHRQVAMALRTEQGLAISGETVLKLMREEGLSCRIRRRRYNSYRGETGKVAANVPDRDFKAEAPTKKLVTDVTEFKVAGAKAYLSPVMDLYNNEIVAWSVSRSPNLAQTMEMLDRLEPLLNGPALLQLRSRLAVPAAVLSEAIGGDGACAEHVEEGYLPGQRLHGGVLRASQRRALQRAAIRVLRVIQGADRRLHHLREHTTLPRSLKRNDPGAVPRPFDQSRLVTLFNRPNYGV